MRAAALERTVDLGDGASTHVTQWGDGQEILLCVHGITSSRMSWQRTAEFFAARYRIVAYDQRGHGDSAAVAGPMTLERSLLDLEAVRAAFEGPVRALIGHSWGGAVALLGGRRIDCDRVVAIDPMVRVEPGTFEREYVDDVRAVLAAAPAEREEALRAMFASLPPAEVDAKLHAMRSMTAAPLVALGVQNDVDAGGWDLREAVRAYPKPLYMPIADTGESVLSADDVAFVRADGGPNIRLEVYAGEPHTLQRTAFERFAQATAAFLDS